MSWELFVGLRYLRARRRGAFLSLISAISLLGVTIGVATLNIVLAVMTGFEQDLRDKILSFNPHIVVVSYSGPIEGQGRLVERVRAVDGVVAAAPFTIHWKGGVHTDLRVRKRRTGEHRHQTAPDVVEAVRQLARILPDQQIAAWLGRAGLRTPTGAHYTRALVASVRHLRGIEACSEERRHAEGWL